MSGQFGKAADSSGRKTTPETVQAVIAAQWANSKDSPIVGGGAVTGLANMAYQVAAGVGLIATPAGAAFTVWDETTTALTTAPGSGTATDTIYADADGKVHMVRGNAPSGVCIIDKRTVQPGTTATTSTTSTYNRIWAISRGQGPVKIAEYIDPTVNGWANSSRFLWATAAFAIPHDYDLRVALDYNLTVRGRSELGSADTDDPIGSMWVEIYLDGQLQASRELEYNRIAMLRQTMFYLQNIRAGRHTIEVYRKHLFGREAEHHAHGNSRLTVYRDSMVA